MTVSSVSRITATSDKSWQDALENGVRRAAQTLRGIEAVEVLRESATVEKGEIKDYVVELKILFRLED